jgi:GNAT superfamily N-acetyltransferase
MAEMDENEALAALRNGWSPLGVKIDAYLNPRNRTVSLTKIEVKKDLQKTGLGTKAMEDLVAYADQYGLMITLSPSTDFGASSVARLRRFYERFGFVQNKGRNRLFEISDSMYRLPGGAPA